MSLDPSEPIFVAAIDLVARTGAKSFQIRFSDDEEPTIWMAVASFMVNNQGKVVKHGRTKRHECAAAMTPVEAVLRLADQLIDGAQCSHCGRPSGVTKDWEGDMPLSNVVCWYRYDPELHTFRRGCEGDNP